MGSEPILQLS